MDIKNSAGQVALDETKQRELKRQLENTAPAKEKIVVLPVKPRAETLKQLQTKSERWQQCMAEMTRVESVPEEFNERFADMERRLTELLDSWQLLKRQIASSTRATPAALSSGSPSIATNPHVFMAAASSAVLPPLTSVETKNAPAKSPAKT